MSFCALVPWLSAQSEPADVSPPAFSHVDWLPVVLPALQKASVATDAIRFAEPGSTERIGDTVTVLAQSSEEGRIRQWAIVLALHEIKPEEKKLRTPSFSLYLTSGAKVDFTSGPFSGMLIHVFGPFSSDHGSKGSKDIWSGSLINPQYLGLGLDGTANFCRRIHDELSKQAKDKPFSFSLSVEGHPPANPYPPEMKEMLDRLHVTAAEERSYAGLMVALGSFFGIASQTPGVRDIIFEAADIPWLSVLGHGGRIDDVHYELTGPYESLNPADWGMPPNTKVSGFGMMLMLYGKPALLCHFAVTSPRVPILNSAGILGIAARRPDGKGPLVTIRVMAGRPAM